MLWARKESQKYMHAFGDFRNTEMEKKENHWRPNSATARRARQPWHEHCMSDLWHCDICVSYNEKQDSQDVWVQFILYTGPCDDNKGKVGWQTPASVRCFSFEERVIIGHYRDRACMVAVMCYHKKCYVFKKRFVTVYTFTFILLIT